MSRSAIRLCSVSVLSACVALLTGCASPTKVDLVATGKLTAVAEPSKLVELSKPAVIMDNGVLDISGTIQRKPGMENIGGGHIDLTVVAADGKVVNQLTLEYRPRELPHTGERHSKYELRYIWEPPQGATVRVEFDDGSKCAAIAAAARRSGTPYGSSVRMDVGAGPVPYGAPGGAVYQRPVNTIDPASQYQVTRPVQVQGAYSPAYNAPGRR